MNTEGGFLTLPQFAAKLQISPRTGRRLLSSGSVGFYRIGGAVRIHEAEVERFLAERYTPARNRQEARPQSVAEAIDRVLPRIRAAR